MSNDAQSHAIPKPPYTTRQYMDLCGISENSVYSRIKSGMIKAHKEGRFWMIDSEPIPKGNPDALARKRDLTGQRFGRLVVLGEAARGRGNEIRYHCVCDCGNTTVTYRNSLMSGRAKSCGCYNKDQQAERLSKELRKYDRPTREDRLYKVWKGMRERCFYAKHKGFKYYGGRGITVCDEWRSDFAAFESWALANGYDRDARHGDCTLDRVDVDGDYCPENCRWVSMAVQAKNKRSNQTSGSTPPPSM